MPYTPPSQSLPSVHQFDNPSSSASPVNHHRRNHSDSSTSYIRRHRRSPSVTKAFVLPGSPSATTNPNPNPSNYFATSHAGPRQSPRVNIIGIPGGSVISPPESPKGSTNEEELTRQKNNNDSQDGFVLDELEAALRSIERRRESSPNRDYPAEGEMSAATDEPGAISLFSPSEATCMDRSHSRSCSFDDSIPIPKAPDDSDCTSLSESSDQEVRCGRKPPMVRKKSGELVRPALRPASATRRPLSVPGTPTFSKAVHFDSNLEHIRHFLQLDKPLAVSANTSPADEHSSENEFPFGGVDTAAADASSFEWELRLPNFPEDSSNRAHQPVRLERVHLSTDRTMLVGVVAVANLAFQKLVVARFTFDHWKTISEVTADYSDDVRRKQAHDGYDRFTFSINLADQANLEEKTMFACIRYSANGQEYWDNNNHVNYQVEFVKSPKRRTAKHDHPMLPRSRRSGGSREARRHSVPPSFDDFSGLDHHLSFDHPSISSKKSPLLSQEGNSGDFSFSESPKRRDKQARQPFGNRYDFGASLSATMRTKPTQDRTTLMAEAKSQKDSQSGPQRQASGRKSKPGLFIDIGLPATEVDRQGVHYEKSKPSSLVSGKRPQLDSLVYKELVDKYCFYAPSKNATCIKQDTQTTTDGASGVESKPTENVSNVFEPFPSPSLSPSPSLLSSSSTPSSPDHSSPHMDSASARPQPSPSPSSSSTVSFGCPYDQSVQNHFFTEAQTPAAIRG